MFFLKRGIHLKTNLRVKCVCARVCGSCSLSSIMIVMAATITTATAGGATAAAALDALADATPVAEGAAVSGGSNSRRLNRRLGAPLRISPSPSHQLPPPGPSVVAVVVHARRQVATPPGHLLGELDRTDDVVSPPPSPQPQLRRRRRRRRRVGNRAVASGVPA